MITIKKNTEDKRVSYSGETSNEQTTSVNFSLLDGPDQVGSGAIRRMGAEMPGGGNTDVNFNLRSALTTEEIYAKLAELFETI